MLFFLTKRKIRVFFAAKNFCGPGRSGFFSKKIGTAGKFTPEKNISSQMYIRLSDNYPIIGWPTYTSF